MTTPQDSRARRRQKRRRTIKNKAWSQAQEAAAAGDTKPQAKAKKAT